MDHLLTATWEAHHPTKNHHRRYEIVVGRDLLNHWTLAVLYGRVGQTGRELRYVAREPEVLRAIIRDRLTRRQTAPKRIGCAYRLTRCVVVAGLDPHDWLPPGFMC